MKNEQIISPIGYIHTDFPEKFGVPRQSSRVECLEAEIEFLPEYSAPEAFRGIEEFSHLWLIFDFSLAHRDTFSPTVRPPRLGGNKRMGVFATRSPYRPNPIGLSSVKLIAVEKTKNEGTTLLVSGVDMLDGSPIYDIKPYLSFTDSHPEATGGFSDSVRDLSLSICITDEQRGMLGEECDTVIEMLKNDPHPHYKQDPEREYGMSYKDFEIKFKIDGNILTVSDVYKKSTLIPL